MVAFDTNGADNPWDASYSEYAYKRFDKWRHAYELVAMGAKITQVNGRAVSWSKRVGDAKFERPFFDACVAVLKLAEESGFFDCLPRAARFGIGVEAPLSGNGRSWAPHISRSQ